MSQVPIVAFATSKGGAGKTTACLAVASEIARKGEKVTILDADPQQSASQWFRRCLEADRTPQGIEVVPVLNVEELGRALKSLPDDGIVLIDVQGALTPIMAIVAAKADLIAVPSQASKIDVVEALSFVTYVSHIRNNAPIRLFFNGVDGIAPTTHVFKDAVSYILENQIPYFTTMLNQRPIFRALTDNGGTLASMKGNPQQIEKARQNVIALVNEILECLSDEQPTPAEVQQNEPA